MDIIDRLRERYERLKARLRERIDQLTAPRYEPMAQPQDPIVDAAVTQDPVVNPAVAAPGPEGRRVGSQSTVAPPKQSPPVSPTIGGSNQQPSEQGEYGERGEPFRPDDAPGQNFPGMVGARIGSGSRVGKVTVVGPDGRVVQSRPASGPEPTERGTGPAAERPTRPGTQKERQGVGSEGRGTASDAQNRATQQAADLRAKAEGRGPRTGGAGSRTTINVQGNVYASPMGDNTQVGEVNMTVYNGQVVNNGGGQVPERTMPATARRSPARAPTSASRGGKEGGRSRSGLIRSVLATRGERLD